MSRHFDTYHPAGYRPPAGSWASSDAIRKTMLACGSRNTRPEVRLRSLLHRRGLRFRVHLPPVNSVRRTADLAFTHWRLAVLVDGCFWHGCSEHFVLPATNGAYWSAKIEGNRVRDRATDAAFRRAGWTVLRVWEHTPVEDACQKVQAALAELRSTEASASVRERRGTLRTGLGLPVTAAVSGHRATNTGG
jgi:DNA mismatch endonuclease (patch repair protein)